MNKKSNVFSGTMMVLLCAMMMVFGSCAESKLKAAIEEGNKMCPLSLGVAGEMTSITYEDDAVNFLFTMDEQFTNIDVISANPEAFKNSFITGMKNEKTQKLFEIMIEANADLVVIMKGKTSGKEATVRLTSSELKEELEKPMPTAEDKLKASITEANRNMPLDTGSGIIMTELKDDGETVVYMAKVTDKKQLELIASSTENVKNSQRTVFKMFGPAEKMFFEYIADAGRNLGYTYYAEGSDKTVEVVHTNAELKELLGN